MATEKFDHRTYGHCPTYAPQTAMDFSAAVAAPWPMPLFRNGFAKMGIMEAVILVTETLDTADAVVRIGTPADPDHFAEVTIPNTTAAGTVLAIDLTANDIEIGEIVEVTYVQRAGAGEAVVLMNIGEALHEVE